MKRLPLFTLLAALALSGCHKKATPQAEGSSAVPDSASSENPSVEVPSVTSQPTQPSKPLPPPPPAVAARAENTVRQNVVGEVDNFLTSELRRFAEKNGRLPESFAEFATRRLDSIPRPPEGKKWVIDADNLQVKAVTTK